MIENNLCRESFYGLGFLFTRLTNIFRRYYLGLGPRMRSANVLGGLLTGVFVSLLAMLVYNPPITAVLVIVAVTSLGTVFVLKNQERNVREYEKRKHILTSPPPGGRWYTPEPAQFFGLPPDMPEEQKKGIRRTGFRDPKE